MSDSPIFDAVTASTAPIDVPEDPSVTTDLEYVEPDPFADDDGLTYEDTPEEHRMAQHDPEDDSDGNNTLNGGK